MITLDTHTHTHTAELEEKEAKIKHHRTRFIVYGALWLLSGVIAGCSTLLGAWIGSFFGPEGVVWGAFAFLCLGGILALLFFILGVYHLIKWLNA